MENYQCSAPKGPNEVKGNFDNVQYPIIPHNVILVLLRQADNLFFKKLFFHLLIGITICD